MRCSRGELPPLTFNAEEIEALVLGTHGQAWAAALRSRTRRDHQG
jgi:predicted DNA-binding transcriptional regulator YafY